VIGGLVIERTHLESVFVEELVSLMRIVKFKSDLLNSRYVDPMYEPLKEVIFFCKSLVLLDNYISRFCEKFHSDIWECNHYTSMMKTILDTLLEEIMFWDEDFHFSSPIDESSIYIQGIELASLLSMEKESETYKVNSIFINFLMKRRLLKIKVCIHQLKELISHIS